MLADVRGFARNCETLIAQLDGQLTTASQYALSVALPPAFSQPRGAGITRLHQMGSLVVGVEQLQGANTGSRGKSAAGEPHRITAQPGIARRVGNAEMPTRDPRSCSDQQRLFQLRQRQRRMVGFEGQRSMRNFHTIGEAPGAPAKERIKQREGPHFVE